jgi:hypothetical protein
MAACNGDPFRPKRFRLSSMRFVTGWSGMQ